MKKHRIISYLLFIFLFAISLCKEDIYGNIKLSFTIGNYLKVFQLDTLKTVLLSLGVSLISVVLMVIIFLPFVNYLTGLKKRKQQMLLLFVLLPLCINNFYKDVLFIGINNTFLRLFFNTILILSPIVIITMFFILKEINKNEIIAAKDLGGNCFHVFKTVILPKIKTNAFYWLCFLTFLGSNLIIINNSLNVGGLVYANINGHMHIPFMCSILCVEYLLFIIITKIGGSNEIKNN